MNIAKALKKKSALSGEVRKLVEVMGRENVQLNNNTSRFDVKEAYTQYKEKTAELIALKAQIATANSQIWGKLFTIVELKGRVTMLRGLDTKEGSYRERDYTQTIENKYTPQLDAKFVQNEIADLEGEIQEIQDFIDDYNHANSI